MMPNNRDSLTEFSRTERGVSPVIGVALLIAITVVLAAVIGFVVLDAGTGPGTDQPSARLAMTGDASNDELTLNHEGGDPINTKNVIIKSSATGVNKKRLFNVSSVTATTLQTGDSVDLSSYSGNDFSSGETVTLIYDPPNSEGQTQLAEFTFP